MWPTTSSAACIRQQIAVSMHTHTVVFRSCLLDAGIWSNNSFCPRECRPTGSYLQREWVSEWTNELNNKAYYARVLWPNIIYSWGIVITFGWRSILKAWYADRWTFLRAEYLCTFSVWHLFNGWRHGGAVVTSPSPHRFLVWIPQDLCVCMLSHSPKKCTWIGDSELTIGVTVSVKGGGCTPPCI